MEKRTRGDKSKLPFIGKIKIGEKDAQRGFPKAIDYFRPYGDFEKQFKETFCKDNAKCTQLKVRFLTQDALNVFWTIEDTEWYAQCYINENGFEVAKIKNPKPDEQAMYIFENDIDAMEWRNQYQLKLNKAKVEWKRKLTLDFILSEMNIAGFWRFETKGDITMIDPITNMYDACKTQYKNDFYLVPFYLSVSMKNSKNNGQARRFPVVTLTPAVNIQNIENAKIINPSNPLLAIMNEKYTNNDVKALQQSNTQVQVATVKQGVVMTEKAFNMIMQLLDNGTPEEVEKAVKNYNLFCTPPNSIPSEYKSILEKRIS